MSKKNTFIRIYQKSKKKVVVKFLEKLLYNQNWNIGFCEQTPEQLVVSKKLNKVQWMKHPYKDRWFADPFIYKITEEEIIVFVEECNIGGKPKGILCELHVDKRTKRLKERYILLELDTHLSYPAIIEHEGKVYVYPENGLSGKLNIYEYDVLNHRLINPVCILNEAVADATIFRRGDTYFLIATKYPKTQEEAYLYHSDSLFGSYLQVYDIPVQKDLSCSRPAGNWIVVSCDSYRPAQDCVKNYGNAISLMKIDSIEPTFVSKKEIVITPIFHKYKRGIHTINFKDNLCVVDGCGYLYPIAGDIYNILSKIKHLIFK